MVFGFDKTRMPRSDEALPGRETPLEVKPTHAVNGHSIMPPWPDGMSYFYVGMGCFWGAERLFWQQPGVWVTAVGYAAGYTKNPSYEEVCSGMTGHNEVVLVVYDPQVATFEQLLTVFWEGHDPTQGMRQGNDRGTQYRSGLYCTNESQQQLAEQTANIYQQALNKNGHGRITTEILPAPEFYYAESWHQQYLAKQPGGYCGLGGTGIKLDASLL